MQVIKFFISDQRAWRYTSGVITEGADLKFEFVFKTDNWNTTTKTAVFSYKGKNYEAELDAYNQCTVPKEAIHDPCFKVSLYNGNGLITNTVKIPIEPKEGVDDNTTATSSVVYIPHIDDDKILTWMPTKVTDGLIEIPPTDLNPFDEWTEDGDTNSEYEWEEE